MAIDACLGFRRRPAGPAKIVIKPGAPRKNLTALAELLPVKLHRSRPRFIRISAPLEQIAQ